MNEPRIFICSRQCHQSFKRVLNKGQTLHGTPPPFSELIQSAEITKLKARRTSQVLQNPIIQLTDTRARYPPQESRVSPSM